MLLRAVAVGHQRFFGLLYENYLIFLNYLFRFGDVESHLEQFDDDLKNKVLDFYRKNIPKTDLLSFME